jgi:hypothetical protein
MSDQFFLNFDAPRSGNTGALISSARIDCLEFSLYGFDWQTIVRRFLCLDPSEFETMSTGLRGYAYRVCRGHVQLLWSDASQGRPVKCLISGQGMDEIGCDGVYLIREVLRANDASFKQVASPITQLHLALDDRSGSITAELVNDCITSGLLVSRFRESQRIDGFQFRNDGDTRMPMYKGQTWYLGSFKGDRLVRCYDKRMERIASGEPDPGPWYRFEIQARKKSATPLAVALAREGLSGSGGIIRGIIDFRELDDENESRRTVCDWWLKFCDGLVAVRTGVKKSSASLVKITKWLERSVSRRLAEVRAVLGDLWLNDLMRIGESKTDQGSISCLAAEACISPRYLGFGRLNMDDCGFVPF